MFITAITFVFSLLLVIIITKIRAKLDFSGILEDILAAISVMLAALSICGFLAFFELFFDYLNLF